MDRSQKDFKLAVVIFMIPPPTMALMFHMVPAPLFTLIVTIDPHPLPRNLPTPPPPPPPKKNSKWSFMKKTFQGKVYAAGYDAIISKYTHMLLF